MAQERPISAAALPHWRKLEIVLNLVRSGLRGRIRGGQLPIIHRIVKIRESNGKITFGKLCEIHERCVLSCYSPAGSTPAKLTIGGRTSVWYGTVISARHEISIGSNCAISWNCTILDNDMHELQWLPGDERPAKGNYVRIADHVWIGANSIILKGVTIGENAVVAAGSIVTRDVPPNTLVAGAPAKIVKQIAGWK